VNDDSGPKQLDLYEAMTAGEYHAARDAEAARAESARAEAIAQAEANASRPWRDAAYLALLWCARHRATFTSDDVIERLERTGAPVTHNLSALGPLFQRAARAGVIHKTGHSVLSRNPRRHRDLTVWSGGAR
jgi:hypothetical protein